MSGALIILVGSLKILSNLALQRQRINERCQTFRGRQNNQLGSLFTWTGKSQGTGTVLAFPVQHNHFLPQVYAY